MADRLWSNNFIQGVIAGGFCALRGAEDRQIKVAGAYSQTLLQSDQAANGCLSRGPHEKVELMKNRQIGFSLAIAGEGDAEAGAFADELRADQELPWRPAKKREEKG